MVSGVRLVVLGKQGAGKGTQCVRLSHHYVVPHVSTGDMLRAAVKSRTPLGERAQADMDRGDLVPDEVTVAMVRDMVVNLEVPTHAVLRRLAARRVCEDCGTNYSVSSPPAIRGTCDVCGGEVVQREDDTEEAITRRLELYARQTAPLLDFYRKAHLLATVNGTGSADMVTRRVVRAIDRQLMDDRGRPRSEGD